MGRPQGAHPVTVRVSTRGERTYALLSLEKRDVGSGRPRDDGLLLTSTFRTTDNRHTCLETSPDRSFSPSHTPQSCSPTALEPMTKTRRRPRETFTPKEGRHDSESFPIPRGTVVCTGEPRDRRRPSRVEEVERGRKGSPESLGCGGSPGSDLPWPTLSKVHPPLVFDQTGQGQGPSPVDPVHRTSLIFLPTRDEFSGPGPPPGPRTSVGGSHVPEGNGGRHRRGSESEPRRRVGNPNPNSTR